MMKGTIHQPATDWRAITNGTVAIGVYVLVVLWEWATALVLSTAAVQWFSVVFGHPRRWADRPDRARQLSSLGWVMALILFGGGFLTIAGEWFRMWANKDVNASSAALQNVILAGLGLLLVHLPGTSRPA